MTMFERTWKPDCALSTIEGGKEKKRLRQGKSEPWAQAWGRER